jgi:hypothetical protein
MSMTDIEAKHRELAARRQASRDRLLNFCARFVREHHSGLMVEDQRTLIPLSEPAYGRDGFGNMNRDWWLNTNSSMGALGGVWIAHLFDRHGLYDHAWVIGRSDQEPWAVVSEPYDHVKQENIEQLRRELKKIGVELIQYPTEQSTHAPGRTLPLVANIVDIHKLMGAVARQIVTACDPMARARQLRQHEERQHETREQQREHRARRDPAPDARAASRARRPHRPGALRP